MENRPRIPYLAITFAILAIITFIACSPQQQVIVPAIERMTGGGYGVSTGSSVPSPSIAQLDTSAPTGATAQSAPTQSMPYYPYPSGGEVPSTDTREYLKQYYNATLKTRHVVDLTLQVATDVRGFGGRVDQTNSSDQSGYVQFVIPADQYDQFRSAMRGLVGDRFITEQTSAQNLLPQKQGIEQEQKTAQGSIDSLTAQRQKLVASHQSTIASLQSRIDNDQAEYDALVAQSQTTTDPTQLANITARETTLSNELASLRSQLASENASYAQQKQSLDQQLGYASSSLASANTQNQDLLDNVATVSGTISVQFISYWQIARLYLPGYSIPAIFAFLSVLSFLWERQLWFFERRRSTLP